MQNEKQKNTNLLKDAGASRFIIDLREEVGHSASLEQTGKNTKKFDLENFYEKLEDFNIGSRFKNWKEKTKKPIRVDRKKIKSAAEKITKAADSDILYNESRLGQKYLFILASALPGVKNASLIYAGRAKKIAIAPARFIYKIFHTIGWTLTYIVRLFYFSGLAVLKVITPVKNGIKILLESAAREFRRNPRRENVERLKKFFPSFRPARFLSALANRRRGEREEGKSNSIRREQTINHRNSLKPTFAFAITLIFLVLPFKAFTYYKSLDLGSLRGRVVGTAEEAVGNLFLAGQSAGSMEFRQAQDNFNQAADKFVDAEKELSPISDTLLKIAGIIPASDAKLASESKDVLQAGKLAAMLGESISAAIDGVLKSETIGGSLNNFIDYGERALAIANELASSISGIDEKNIPDEYRDKFISAKSSLGFMAESLNELVNLAGAGEVFMADGGFKRYLIVFQNNAEMRASGGFIGSYALLDVADGKIKNIEIPTGGSYDTEGGLKETIIAPEPLHLVDPLWHFWDANWWPDWQTSAQKLEWFYEKSGGPTVDGVIALTPNVLEKMLSVIGPVDMTEKYGVEVNAQNFWETTREIIETSDLKYKEAGSDASQEEAKPKAIIGDLARKIIEELPRRIDTREKLLGLVKSFEKLLDEKYILLYFNDKNLEAAIEDYGWDGGLKYSSWDYLSVINSNIAGGKSDRKIKETINITAEVQGDGRVINTLKIKREHSGIKFSGLTGVRNVDWMRIYVPLGAKLISASGFEKPDEVYFEKPDDNWIMDKDILDEKNAKIDEFSGTKIYEEAGKTVFANWSMVDPGDTEEIELKYELPFIFQEEEPFTLEEIIKNKLNPDEKQAHVYALLAQKQSGSESDISFNLILPDNIKSVWSYPADVAGSERGLSASDKLDTDKYWAVVMEK